MVRTAALLVISLACTLDAQPSVARLVEGRVMRPGEASPVPVARQWVVLHRVGTDRAAPLDSVQSGADGRFRFRYTRTGDPQALYFVSARYDDIAYFSPPLRADTVRGDDADIVVYATTTDTSFLKTQGRHFVVSTPRAGRREIAEVFEIENSGTQTVVAADSVRPLWSIGLPAQAESASVAPGDVTAAAVSFRGGRAELFAPISPGMRQLVLTYVLRDDISPIPVPVERQAGVLEVLLEEPRANVEGAGLQEVAPGNIEGKQFHRYLAQDAAPNAVFRVTLPAVASPNRGAMYTVAALFALAMVGALIVWFVRSREPRAESREPRAGSRAPRAESRAPVSTSQRLLAELATLDARFEESGSDADRPAYERERARLKSLIAHTLAEEEGPT
jgi:hypothetical protein